MKALLLDDTHPLLEQDLQAGGLPWFVSIRRPWKN